MAFNILIVDDSMTVRKVIEKTLRMADIPLGDVFHASNGQQGLDALASNWIDLVFADINMPVMTGVEMIQKMAEDGVTKSIPVVVVSTEGSATRIEELKDHGVAAYIRKPFKAEQFSTVVHEILGTTHA